MRKATTISRAEMHSPVVPIVIVMIVLAIGILGYIAYSLGAFGKFLPAAAHLRGAHTGSRRNGRADTYSHCRADRHAGADTAADL